MIPESAFDRWLGLDECWKATSAEYRTKPTEHFVIRVRETDELWSKLVCPTPKCGQRDIVCHDHAEERVWRHSDAFNRRAEIVAAPVRARCKACERVWRVPVPWEGQSKHFTHDFEAFALTLMREMPVKRAAQILGEHDTRLWRMLLAHGKEAYGKLDLSALAHVGADEMNTRKGQDYLTVFADLVQNRVIFATEGKDHTAFQRFVEEILKHNGDPEAIRAVAIDLGKAYQKGAREQLPEAQIVFDPFHVTALVGDAMDTVRRRESRSGPEAKAALKKTIHLFRKNPEDLSQKEQAHLAQLDLKHLATGQAYQIRLELHDIYQHTIKPERARYRLECWVNWVRGKCERFGKSLAPMKRAADTIERHMEGILAHWTNSWLSTGYLEGLNSVFSAVKRKARGYRNSSYMIAMLYFVAGKLPIIPLPVTDSPSK
jgi:transposase